MSPSLILVVLASLLFVTPQANAAKKKANKTVMQPPAVSKLINEGLTRLKFHQYNAAITSMNKAVRMKPGVSTYFLLGWAHYQRGFKKGSIETADRDDAQLAIDSYNMALSKDPKLSELTDPSRLYFSLALCYEAVESYDQSLAYYKRALKAAPNKALIPLHAARLRLKMQEEDKAIANVQLALKKARTSGHEGALIAAVKREPAFLPLVANEATRRILGVPASAEADGIMIASNLDFHGEDMRDSVRDAATPPPVVLDPAVAEKISTGNTEYKFRRYQTAVTAYREALELDQNHPLLSKDQVASLYEKIGISLNKLGQSEAAYGALEKSLEKNPANANARYQLALSLAMSGKTSQSLQTLRQSFAAAHDSAELRRIVLLAKTDVELEAVRDLPEFSRAIAGVSERVALR